MSETAAPRKLATIVALDVAGYSARTEADEAKTTAEVAALRKVIGTIAAKHGGHVFNTAGDGFMLEFGSSLAAVEAAFELAQTCEPKVRVGVHVGDVVPQPNGDLLGHGVNVAARLMARAEPGSTLISADVKRMIRGPVADRLQSLGTFKLDKMAETIEAFALAAVASLVVAVQPKSAEPLLAVLPFDNLSNDPEMQFLSDGISEEILQVLTQRSDLKVIGRTSAFHFRGSLKVEAARALRATHILDGAVRKSGSRLRVNAQLTDGANGAALWSDRYDREFAEVFDLQDDIAQKVADALQSVFAPSRQLEQIDPTAYELLLRAREANLPVTDEGYRRTIALLEEAVRRAPGFAPAWAFLGGARTLLLSRDEDSVGTPQHAAALEATQRALSLDPNCAAAYRVLSMLQPAFAGYTEKIRFASKGLDLAPNDHVSLVVMSGAWSIVGRLAEGAPYMLRAVALEPFSPFIAAMAAGSLYVTGRHDEAMTMFDDAIRRMPPSLFLITTKFSLLRDLHGDVEAAKFLDAEQAKGIGWNEEIGSQLRFLLLLPNLPPEQRGAIFTSMLDPQADRVLRLNLCHLAAEFGFADLAFERLFEAFDTGRPIGGFRSSQGGVNRANTPFFLFIPAGKALRRDKRFPILCQRMGLVDYWITSGHWPDCATEVPYDFKAECEKAAQGVS